MLTFFRRIRKGLLGDGATSKYLLYAVGEILLVMIGILLALQVNNWNEWRKERKFERKLLVELRETMIDDYEPLNWSINGNKKAQRSCEIILSHFNQNLPYQDSLALHFEQANIWWRMGLKQNAFENAKSHGLDMIEDDSTRVMLSFLYQTSSSFAHTLDERQSLYYYNTVTPILTDLFESIDKGYGIATSGNIPYDFEQLKANKRYRNILKTNIGNRHNYNEWTRMAISIMKKLESRLLKEIDRR